MKYIYQKKGWPNFKWDINKLVELLGEVKHNQGTLLGKMELVGFDLQNEAFLESFTSEITKSNEIEGVSYDSNSVRSSIAKKLGINLAGLTTPSPNIDKVVELFIDATTNFNKPLTKRRLFKWHRDLFPDNKKSVRKIIVGKWRTDSEGPMQVVSGAMGKEIIHYQAPPAEVIDEEMEIFLNWFNSKSNYDLLIKASIAHLWFVTLHPFEDGNGRIARVITEMLLARSDGTSKRFYSMSSQILKNRKSYYEILEWTQKGSLEITEWIIWFLSTLNNAILSSEKILSSVIKKHKFWNLYGSQIKNERQRKVLNKLLNGFTGNLTTSKWAKITKCSHDSALRDIQDLVNKGILVKSKSGGRSTNYELAENIK